MSYYTAAQRNGQEWAQPKPQYVNRDEYHCNLYRDYETGRERWAVLHRPTSTWYFPTRYGMKAAIALCRKLNTGVLNHDY